MYIRSDNATIPVTSNSDGSVEYMVMKLPSLDLIINLIYRPPDNKPQQWRSVMDKITQVLQEQGESSNIMVFGDTNLPQVNWGKTNAGIQMDSTSCENTQANNLVEFMTSFFMSQVVEKPTRGMNLLDIVITNNVRMISHNTHIVNANFSDHQTLVTHLN